MNDTVPTPEMINNLAHYLVGGMSISELQEIVHDDLYSLMLNDKEVFYSNLDELDLIPEQFTDENFRSTSV